MNSLFQTDLVTLLKDLVSVLTVGLLGYGFPLVKKVGASLLARVPASERNFLEAAARDAVVFVEAHYTGEGKAKFEEAVTRVIDVLDTHGLKISETDIENAIEAAYQATKIVPVTK